MENNQTRKLVAWLILSAALNIMLVSFFFYWVMRERPPTPYFELRPPNIDEQQTPFAIDHSNEEIIRYFKSLSLEQLVQKLSNSEFVENGYKIRDLSLAVLVTFHHFDLSRALLDDVQPVEIRLISFGFKKDGKPAKVLAYPGLNDKQFETLIAFAKRERWPLTPKGLFLNLKASKNKLNHTLQDAFYLTPEFLSVEMLFSRSNRPIKKQEILNVLLEGNFSMLSQFTEHQKQSADLTKARRQYFLLEYVKSHSRAAAYLLLKTDGPQIVRKLDDAYIKMILSELIHKTEEAQKFSLAILTSPRGDSVRQMAAMRLYEYSGEEVPEKFHHQVALHKFLPVSMNASQVKAEVLNAPVEIAKPKTDSVYIVQEGDSLWKISRRLDIDIDHLKRHNQLTSDFLKPGTALKVP